MNDMTNKTANISCSIVIIACAAALTLGVLFVILHFLSKIW
jgi:hypothetical protein